jgi:hypothetical protein
LCQVRLFVLLGALYYGDTMSRIALCVGVSLPRFMGFPRYCPLLAHRSPWSSFGQEIQGRAKDEKLARRGGGLWYFVVYSELWFIVSKPSDYFVYRQF